MSNKFNLKIYCRTCARIFRRQPLIPLYKSSNPAIDAIKNYQNNNFQISINDRLPQQICSECLNKFNIMNEFLEVCEQSQDILKNLFNIIDNNNYDIDKCEETTLKSENENSLNYENEEFLTEELEEFKIEIIDESYFDFDNESNDKIYQESNRSKNYSSINSTTECDDKIKCEVRSDSDDYFNNNDEGQLEQEQEQEQTIFPCEICERKFNSYKKLTDHEQLHSKTKKTNVVMCEVCGQVVEERRMKQHMNIHRGETNDYTCEHCKKEFSKYRTFILHIRTKHLITPKFHCQLCDRGFKMEYNLRNHMRLEHQHGSKSSKDKQKQLNNKPRPKAHLECLYCMKRFHNTVTLVAHCQTHKKPGINDAKFVCSYCSATFKRADHLKIHVNSQHLKSEEFKCGYCDKVYYASFVLNRHIKYKHSGIKKSRVFCEFCSKSLVSEQYLIRHKMEFHSTEKHLKCPICDERFFRRVQLTAHSKVHNILANDDQKELILKEMIGESSAVIKKEIDNNYDVINDDQVQMLIEYSECEDEQ